MATMYPRVVPAAANVGEQAVWAALERGLGAGVDCWFQARLPGRKGRLSFEADFLLLDERGLLIVEVKGWRAVSVVSADESRVVFRNGASAQHPLLQAFRYQAALLELLRVAGVAGAPIRCVAALPLVSLADVDRSAWGAHFKSPQVLLRDHLVSGLEQRLAAVPPVAEELLTPQQIGKLRNLLSSSAEKAGPDAQQGRLF